MERQNNFTFEYEATLNRLYVFFSDLLDSELDVKDNPSCKHSDKPVDSES